MILKMNINMTDNKESKMKRFVIIFISLIVGYALYWCISDYDYRYNKINSIVGIYKLDLIILILKFIRILLKNIII